MMFALLLVAPLLFLFLLKLPRRSETKKAAAIANGMYFLHVMAIHMLQSHFNFSDSVLMAILAVSISAVTVFGLTTLNKKIYIVF